MLRRDRLFLIVAFSVLAVSVVYRVRAGQSAKEKAGRLEITPIPMPMLSATRSTKDAGTVRFAPEGATVHGLAAAAMYPMLEDGRPAHLKGQNVVAVQNNNGELGLKAWLARRDPLQHGDKWLLHFALWCVVDGGTDPIWWTGWAAITLSELWAGGLEIVPASGVSVGVTVSTRDGQAIPGASLSIDPAYQQSGFSLQYASTGKNGSIVLRGLDVARDWTIALPMGAGPSRQPVQAVWRGGATPRVDLTVNLGGTWSYKPIYVVPPFRGANLKLQKMKGAWPTAGWIPAGRLPTVCYAMWPQGKSLPKIAVKFAGYPVYEFATNKEALCRLLPATSKKRKKK